jgi:hypothetical protein
MRIVTLSSTLGPNVAQMGEESLQAVRSMLWGDMKCTVHVAVAGTYDDSC